VLSWHSIKWGGLLMRKLSLFGYSNVTWDWGYHENTLYPVNVAWSTLDWQAVWLMANERPLSAYPPGIYEQVSHGGASTSTTPASSPLNQNTWIASSGRQLRLDSITIIWTGRMASASACHENLSSPTWQITGSLPHRILQLGFLLRHKPVFYWFTLILTYSQWELSGWPQTSLLLLYKPTVLQVTCSACSLLRVGFLLGLLLGPEMEANIFLWNITLFSMDYTSIMLYARRQKSS
jgi:hypothetical protein